MTNRLLVLAALAAPLAFAPFTFAPPVTQTAAPVQGASSGTADLQQEYRQRREALAARTPDGVFLALGAPEPRHD